MKAKFRIQDENGTEIKQYEMEYTDAKDLQKIWKEARQVWDEYFVEVEVDSFFMNHSHTYKEEILMERFVSDKSDVKSWFEAKCCLCGSKLDGYGNNPSPLKEEGKCCDDCNTYKVIPSRISMLLK